MLIVSFAALSLLWPQPRLERAQPTRRLQVPLVLRVLAGALGVAAFALVLYAGFAGTEVPTANLAPTAIYVLVWVGVPVVSVLLGDVWRVVDPWRALARAGAWLLRAARGGRALRAPLTYPERLGRWPAVVTIAAFAWLELAYVDRDVPSTLAALALAYALIQLVGMGLFGIERWRCARRRLRGPVRAVRPDRGAGAARRRDRDAAAAVGPAEARRGRPRHGRADGRDDRHDDLRRRLQRRAVVVDRETAATISSATSASAARPPRS